MPVESKSRGASAGLTSQVWRFRCCSCRDHLDTEAQGGYLDLGTAQRWARESYNWSRTREGWKCPRCKSQTKGAARAAENP